MSGSLNGSKGKNESILDSIKTLLMICSFLAVVADETGMDKLMGGSKGESWAEDRELIINGGPGEDSDGEDDSDEV